MSVAQLYHISYNGIEAVNAARANALSVGDRAVQPEMASTYAAYRARLGDKEQHVIDNSTAAGLIVRCLPNEVHDIYDSVFLMGYTKPKNASVVESRKPEEKQSFLSNMFAASADRYKISANFSLASMPFVANTFNDATPALRAA